MILLCNHKHMAYEKPYAYLEPMCFSKKCQWCGEPHFALVTRHAGKRIYTNRAGGGSTVRAMRLRENCHGRGDPTRPLPELMENNTNRRSKEINLIELRGCSPRANYTDRATAAC
jgi:hypothetical protein